MDQLNYGKINHLIEIRFFLNRFNKHFFIRINLIKSLKLLIDLYYHLNIKSFLILFKLMIFYQIIF